MNSKKVLGYVMLSVVVLLSALVVVATFGVSFGSDGVDRAVQVSARVPAEKVIQTGALPAGTELKFVNVKTTIVEPDATENLLLALWRLPVLLIAWAIAFLLWRIARSIADGDPFNKANVWRLRAIVAVLVATPLIRFLTDIAHTELISRSPIASLDATTVPLNFTPMLVGLAVFVLAEVFASGVRMRKDVAGLV